MHPVLEAHYDGYRHKAVNGISLTKNQTRFNRDLLAYLLKCHNASYVPSKTEVQNEAAKIADAVSRKSDIEIQEHIVNDSDPLSESSLKFVINHIENTIFFSSVSKNSADSEASTSRILIYACIPSSRLKNEQIEWILQSFPAISNYDNDTQIIDICSLDVPVIHVMNEFMMNGTEQVLTRKIKRTLAENSNSEAIKKENRYTIVQKIKDWYFLSGL